MGEFDFISQYLAPLSGPEGLGLLDDIALWSPPQGHDALFSVDTLIEGVHFPHEQFDADLARKALRVNISDITAKGGHVQGYLLSLCLPKSVSNDALSEFCDGLARDQKQFGLSLWGGDTTRTNGPAVISITIIGSCTTGQAVLRSGADIGDILCVSGTIGDAYLGLGLLVEDHVQHNSLKNMPKGDKSHWRQHYYVPEPPYQHRDIIRNYASAALDVSDGLLADANHLAIASDVELQIRLNDVPVSQATKNWLEKRAGGNLEHLQLAQLALAGGGDDYQTLFCVPPKRLDELRRTALAQGFAFTVIGEACELVSDDVGKRVHCIGRNGEMIKYQQAGYIHF